MTAGARVLQTSTLSLRIASSSQAGARCCARSATSRSFSTGIDYDVTTPKASAIRRVSASDQRGYE